MARLAGSGDEAALTPKPTTYHLVPLLAYPIGQAMEDGATSCLPFLQPVLAHPNWQIQILHAFGSCFGDQMIDSLAIDSEGRVEWSRPHMPVRYLQLYREQHPHDE